MANEAPYTLDTLADTEALTMLKDMAVAMFAVGAEASVAFGVLKKVAGSQTVRMWKLVKQAIHNVYEAKEHRDAICRSPERPDLKLTQEEANGYLAGAIFGIELLASEARAAGKNVDNCVAADKKAAAVKEPWKSQRRRAREAAAKDPSLAGTLDATLASIQATEDAAKAARLSKPYPIALPAANTVIHEPRPPTAAEAEESAAAKLRRLRAAVDAAEDHAAAADADAVASKRLTQRAKAAMEEAFASYREAASIFQGRQMATVSDEEWQAVQEWQDELRSAAQGFEKVWLECAQERRACDDASDDALEALDDARFAVAAEERAQARRVEAERLKAQLERERAEAERECKAERAESAARAARMQAQQAASRARLERERQAFIAEHGWDHDSVRCETPAETRARVDASVRVVGAPSVSTPPKVISLVGMTPDSVRTVGESRAISQQVTGVEERVRLERLLREAVPSPPSSPPGSRTPPPPAQGPVCRGFGARNDDSSVPLWGL